MTAMKQDVVIATKEANLVVIAKHPGIFLGIISRAMSNIIYLYEGEV